MAIYGIGAFYDEDVSEEFIDAGVVGTGWDAQCAPELHHYFRTLKVGDIVYLKAANFGRPITVKGIGLISDTDILSKADYYLTEVGRRVKWISTEHFTLPKPAEKNNVRSNTVYEEFHPAVQQEILKRFKP